jgi:outer membrane protein OmpU
MNNIKKLGLTALAGSLVAVSAQAGEMSVSGSFNATYSTQSGNAIDFTDAYAVNEGNHGVGIGNDKDFSVSGSGELDNGWTFSGYTLMKDTIVVSSSALSLTMGSLGTISTGSQSGGTSTKYDVQTPTAYEEVDDGAAMSLSSNYVGNRLDNNSIYYTSPTFDLGSGLSATVDVEYTPNATGTSPNDGGFQARATNADKSGQSLGLTVTHDSGLKVGIYGAEIESGDVRNDGQDAFEGVWYANYSMGPVSVGYSESYHDYGNHTAVAEAATAAKYVGLGDGIFETSVYSIAFNVNDNLSLSYADAEDTYDSQSNVKGGTEIADVSMDMTSIQAAYSMGAMSIKAYRTETDNVAYSTIGGSLTVNEIAIGLAF